jgi:succinyl-CoA synthetase alpha subunit
VFDAVKAAVRATDANASLVCVSASEAMEAILEDLDAGVRLIVCLTPGVPIHDVVRVHARLQGCAPDGLAGGRMYGSGAGLLGGEPVHLIGPGSPGVFSPGKCVAGIIPQHILSPGSVGVVSRSGSLAYEVTWQLTQAGFGQSTILGIGSGSVACTGFVDVLAMFEDDPSTKQVVLIGEIGGRGEELAAEYVRDRMSKPVVAFIAGQTAPPGRRMGHEGAIIEEYAGTAQLKIDALEAAGVRAARSPSEVPDLLERG